MALPRYPATVRARILAEAARMIAADDTPERGLAYLERAVVAHHELNRAKKSKKNLQKQFVTGF